MTWIDLSGGAHPVLIVDGAVYLHPEDIGDPELRRAACELWAEFARIRHLADPVAEALARHGRRAGGPVQLHFRDVDTFDRAIDQE